MITSAPLTRKQVLEALGYTRNASRSSWSHDDGTRIIFDAWTNRFDSGGRYPMSTHEYYKRVHDYSRRGLTMWLAHLDLVLAGERDAIFINPVPREPGPNQGTKGAKGWLPRYVTGKVVVEGDEVWFEPKQYVALDGTSEASSAADNGLGEDKRVLAEIRALLGDHLAAMSSGTAARRSANRLYHPDARESAYDDLCLLTSMRLNRRSLVVQKNRSARRIEL